MISGRTLKSDGLLERGEGIFSFAFSDLRSILTDPFNNKRTHH